MNGTLERTVGACEAGEERSTAALVLRAAVSMFLGALVIYAAGFAPGILHGQSHDSRHTLGFPCH